MLFYYGNLDKQFHFEHYLVPAVLNDSLHLFMNEFDASDRRLLQPSDLTLDQQLERHLRHKKGRPGIQSGLITNSLFLPLKTKKTIVSNIFPQDTVKNT